MLAIIVGGIILAAASCVCFFIPDSSDRPRGYIILADDDDRT